jgi:hypothetical protein
VTPTTRETNEYTHVPDLFVSAGCGNSARTSRGLGCIDRERMALPWRLILLNSDQEGYDCRVQAN